MTALPLVLLVLFAAVFTQSLSGFGSALVAMSLLPALIGLHVATPLVALVGGTLEVFLLLRYREALNLNAIWQLVSGSLLGIPLGIIFLGRVDEGVMLPLLGAVIAGYALYALLTEFSARVNLPSLAHPVWAVSAGFLAGLLGGAYNTAGPPVILYGNCRRWGPAEFKSNLQGFFLIASVVTIFGHAWSGNLTPEVWRLYLWSLPVIAAGLWAGTAMDRYLRPRVFRRVVLVLLLGMGVWLIFG